MTPSGPKLPAAAEPLGSEFYSGRRNRENQAPSTKPGTFQNSGMPQSSRGCGVWVHFPPNVNFGL